MARWIKAIQVGLTYIGTVIGAGFASGQEILQFFTQYGWMAVWTITLSVILFVWIGIKLMLLSHDVGAVSYEDLNKYLFGDRMGQWISLFTLVILFGVTTVMLAGAGSIFSEQLGWSYQIGLLITIAFAYVVIVRGMDAILVINSIVVPLMFIVTAFIVLNTRYFPSADNWITLGTATFAPIGKVWTAPFLYVAFNLAMAQAVLVPIGGSIKDRAVLKWGGWIGGTGIGLMLFAGHYALSAHMPGIREYEIPMGQIARILASPMQILFIFVIFCEIFTTFIADVYGLSLQICQRSGWRRKPVILLILLASYLVSQIGFSNLLSTLYPFFGLVSLVWFSMMMGRRGLS